MLINSSLGPGLTIQHRISTFPHTNCVTQFFPPHQPLLIPFHIFKINFLIYINFQIHHPELLPLSLWPNFSWLLYLTRILTFASLPLIWLSFLLMLTYCFFIFPCPCTLVIYVFLFIFSFVLSRRKKSFGTFTCISQVIINQSSKNRWEN